MTEINFTAYSRNGEEAMRQRWIAVGIIDDAPGWQFRGIYAGNLSITATQGWHGIIKKPTGELDEDGRPIMATVPGWHANCKAWGPLAESMIAGLPQHDAEGKLLHLFERTWAAYVLGLTETKGIDPTTNFPYGAYSDDGDFMYGDPVDLKTPANVLQ